MKKNAEENKKTEENQPTEEQPVENQNTAESEDKSECECDTDTEKKEKQQGNEAEAEAVESDVDSINNKLLRLQADFLNFKNRTEKEKSSTYGNAVADVIKDLLPVVDNLERALEAQSRGDNSLKNGVKMIYDQMLDVLKKRGMKEIEALNKPFDHNLHYGVAFDSETEAEDGIIIEVFQKGYVVKNKVIRPSMVKIAKK